LYNNEKKSDKDPSKIKTMAEFVDLVNRRIHGLEEFNPDEPLNFEHKVGRGSNEALVVNEINKARADIKKIKKEIATAQRTITNKELRDREIRDLTKQVIELEQKIGDLEKKRIRAIEADKQQLDIFAQINEQIKNGNITTEQVRQFEQRTEDQITESEPTVKSIESKAESTSKAELNEAVREADKFIEDETEDTGEDEARIETKPKKYAGKKQSPMEVSGGKPPQASEEMAKGSTKEVQEPSEQRGKERNEEIIDTDASIPGYEPPPPIVPVNAKDPVTGKEIRPVEFPELVELVRALGAKALVEALNNALGRARSSDMTIKIDPKLGEQGNEEHLVAVLAHEIGHIIDYIPDRFRRGNILGRIFTLKNMMLHNFEGLNVKEIREELKGVSFWWRPMDPLASESHRKYRNRSSELYADAISVLLSSPGTLQQMAPKFFNAFFENLDRKPEARKAYFDIQEEIASGNLAEKRVERIKKGYQKAAEEKQKMLTKSGIPIRERVNEKWNQFLQHLIAYEYPIIRNASKDKFGARLSQGQEIRNILEGINFLSNDLFLFLKNITNDIHNKLIAAGIDPMDMGVILQAEAKLGARKDIISGQFTEKYAKEAIETVKKSYSPEQVEALEKAIKDFHDIIFDVMSDPDVVKFIGKYLYQNVVVPNKDSYATHIPVDYVTNKISGYLERAEGTFRYMSNPYYATIEKASSIYLTAKRNAAKLAAIDFLIETDPKFIKPAELKNGVPVMPKEGWAIVPVIREGKREYYETIELYANALNRPEQELFISKNLLKPLNRVFKPLVTTFNLTFALYNNLIRDHFRTVRMINTILLSQGDYKRLIPFLTDIQLTAKRLGTIKHSAKLASGKTTPLIEEMLKQHAITPFSVYFGKEYDPTIQNDEMSIILHKAGFNHEVTWADRNIITKTVSNILDGIRFAASTGEHSTKIAGYTILKNNLKDAKSAGFYTRNFVGTPNFMARGIDTKTANEVWVFSNVVLQSLRSEGEMATHKGTKKWYAASLGIQLATTSAIVSMGAAGLFGDEIKKMYEDIGQYDMDNYICIPYGRNPDTGKVKYIRIPPDPLMAMFHSMIMNTTRMYKNKEFDKGTFTKILTAPMSQLPSFTPFIEIAEGWVDYISGKNPVDDFRNKNVIPDREFKSGIRYSAPFMIDWTLDKAGLSFIRVPYNIATGTMPQDITTTEYIWKVSPIVKSMFRESNLGMWEDIRKRREKLQEEKSKDYIKRRDFIDDLVIECLAKGYDYKYDPQEDIARRYFNINKKQWEDELTQEQAEELQNMDKMFQVKMLFGLKNTKSVVMGMILNENSIDERRIILEEYAKHADSRDVQDVMKFIEEEGIDVGLD
jgi:hypothetical protein